MTANSQKEKILWFDMSLLCIIDEAMKRYIIPHHIHIGSHLAYFFLTYVFNGILPSPEKHVYCILKVQKVAGIIVAPLVWGVHWLMSPSSDCKCTPSEAKGESPPLIYLRRGWHAVSRAFYIWVIMEKVAKIVMKWECIRNIFQATAGETDGIHFSDWFGA